MTAPGEIRKLSKEIRKSAELLTVLGDEMRQHLILVMMESGMRVNDIAAKTSLSRLAVSHHLQILKDAGIIRVRREGTNNYYYSDADAEAMNQLIGMLKHAQQIMSELSDRSGND